MLDTQILILIDFMYTVWLCLTAELLLFDYLMLSIFDLNPIKLSTIVITDCLKPVQSVSSF